MLPELAVVTKHECYGEPAPLDPYAVSWCLIDPGGDDPALANDIPTRELAENIAQRCNNYPPMVELTLQAAEKLTNAALRMHDLELEKEALQVDKLILERRLEEAKALMLKP